MESLIIPSSEDTPKIHFIPSENIYSISEKSLPEDAYEFYKPVFDWFQKLLENPCPKFDIDFNLEYFNTASAKQIAKLLLMLENLSEKSDVTVRWHYNEEDTDMLNAGMRFNKLIKVNFEFVRNEE